MWLRAEVSPAKVCSNGGGRPVVGTADAQRPTRPQERTIPIVPGTRGDRTKVRWIRVVAILAAIPYVGTAVVLGVTWGVDTGAKTAAVGEGPRGAGDPDAGAATDEARISAFDAAQTPGIAGVPDPCEHTSTLGWVRELPFSRSRDDWEPAIAADNAGRVYMLTTRYGAEPACKDCPRVFIALKRSMDVGATWLPHQRLCRCHDQHKQFDPVLAVDDSGRVSATWMDGLKPGMTFSRSDDFGATWTDPQSISGLGSSVLGHEDSGRTSRGSGLRPTAKMSTFSSTAGKGARPTSPSRTMRATRGCRYTCPTSPGGPMRGALSLSVLTCDAWGVWNDSGYCKQALGCVVQGAGRRGGPAQAPPGRVRDAGHGLRADALHTVGLRGQPCGLVFEVDRLRRVASR